MKIVSFYCYSMADDKEDVPTGVPTNEGDGDQVPDNVTEKDSDNNDDNDWDNDDFVDGTGDTLQEPQEPSTPPPTPPMLELPDEGNGMPRALFIPLKMVPFIHPSKSMKEATFNFDLINLGFKIFEVSA